LGIKSKLGLSGGIIMECVEKAKKDKQLFAFKKFEKKPY